MNDEIYEILKNVSSVKDYLNVCSVNKSIKNICLVYKKSVFISLIQKKEFRKDFYNKFEQYLEDYNVDNIINILKIYPVGNFFKNEFSKFNTDQIQFYKFLNNKNHLHSESMSIQAIKHTYFLNMGKLLFFPSNYIDFNLYMINTIKNDDLILFHLENLKHLNKKKYDEYIVKIVIDMFSEVESNTNYEFLYKLRVIESKLPFVVFKVIEDMIPSEHPGFVLGLHSINSTEFADFFAENYEKVKKLCIDFGLH